jgi:chemotaxis protein MotB
MERKPRYLQPVSGAPNRWVISYTDIMTLLLVVFVAISVQSFQNSQPGSDVSTETNATLRAPLDPTRHSGADHTERARPPDPQSPARSSRDALLRAQQRLQQSGLDLRLEERGLVISLPQTILFSSGQDRINQAALPVISQIADVLRDLTNKVSLVGHADAIPIRNHRFKNNWELSAARGLRILEVLRKRYGIPESRLSVVSYGSYSPKGPNDTVDGRAENRRVEIVILDEVAP